MRSVDLLCAVTVTACLSGCAESSLRLTEAAQVTAPPDHVFVVVGQGPFDRTYADEFAAALVTALCGHTSASRSRVLTGLELDDDPVSGQLRAFGADGLLMLQPIGGQVNTGNGRADKVVYRATLLDIRTDRVVWDAEVSHEAGYAFDSAAGRGRAAAERVVRSLVQERIIRTGQSCQGGS